VLLPKLVGPYFGEILCYLDIHTSLTISIHRNITALVNFKNLNISGKRFIGAQKTLNLTKQLYVVTKFGSFPTKFTVSNFPFHVNLINQ
jgi:hypothetical protein